MSAGECSDTTETDAWVALDDHCVLTFKGTATRAFLSRQLTCDIAALAPGKPQFGAWLTPKGRVLALLRLFDLGQDHRVDAIVPVVLADDLIRRLRMFVMRDDVAIEVDAEQHVVGLWGECVESLSQNDSQSPALTIIHLASRPPLAMLAGTSAALRKLLEARCSLHQSSLAQWQRQCIEAGVPQVGLATREAFIPQMINLDRLGAVSFSKGCYPGQEIVARTQHLGRIKRRMFVARAAIADPHKDVEPGDVIVGAQGEDIGGRVVNVQRSDQALLMLVVLPLNSDASSSTVRLHDASGSSLEVLSPPYSLIDPKP